MNYRSIALFTDLDGTLFNSRREVSPENKMAIDRFIAEGGAFGISTGRAPENARRLLPGIHINSWSVVLNGAEAYHFSERKTAFPCCLPQQQMELLIRWTYEMLPAVNIQLCTDSQLLFLSRPEFADADFVATHQPMSNMCIDNALRFPWLKVLFCAPRSVLEQLERHAKETGVMLVADAVYTNEVYLEFLPFQVSKGSCLRKLRRQEELAGRTFIAVGDYTNDIELLQEADIAVAVQNALPDVKTIADYVVCSNDNHALADLINNVIPLI